MAKVSFVCPAVIERRLHDALCLPRFEKLISQMRYQQSAEPRPAVQEFDMHLARSVTAVHQVVAPSDEASLFR